MGTITHASEVIKNRLKSDEGLSVDPKTGKCPVYQKTYSSKTGRIYKDKPTIGYGNTQYENGVTVKIGDPEISKARAATLFNNVFASLAEAQVRNTYKKVPLTQNQFDALCHYVYNTGSFDVYFVRVTIGFIQRIYTSNQTYSFFLQSHVTPGGVKIPDLVVRRQFEADLFLNSNYSAIPPLNFTPLPIDPNYTVQDKPKPEDAYLINKEEQTMADFCKKNNILFSPDELLNYKNNSVNIFKSYSTSQQAANNRKASLNLVGKGAKVAVPMNQIDSASIYTINQTIIYNTNYNAFIESQIKKLINNPNYKKLNIGNSNTKYGSIFKRQDALSVWLWCKSNNDGSGELIDITKYIETISTTVTLEGGNFNITLPFITYDREAGGEFGDDFILNDVKDYKDQGINNYIHKNQSHKIARELNIAGNSNNIDRDSVNDIGSDQKYWKRNSSYFQDMIQQNDLIFIKYEKIEADKSRGDLITDSFISPKALPGGIFDLIGLVDVCSESTQAEGVIRNISLTGRDLSKLLLDDGVYFFPVEYLAKNGEDLIRNSSKSKSGKRLLIPVSNKDDKGNDIPTNYVDGSGELIQDTQFNFYETQSIKEWVTFIFSQLTNIKVCPNEIFDAYGDDRSFIITSDHNESETKKSNFTRVQADGIWNIVKLVLDDSICNRRLADTSLATDTGSLLNLITKVAQSPFCEFSMDTYGDKYYFMIRKPPFSEDSFRTNKCINIFEDDVINDSLAYSNEIYSWINFNPYNSIFGNSDNGAYLALFPSVMFPEFVDIWGSKVLSVTSNMIDFDHSVSDKSAANFKNIENQALEDFDWLIETNMYLPFTRTGTITIKSDRRIKRGMNIRNYGTGEIFYVDSVTQSRTCGETIDGQTILGVSRGMVEKYLQLYFNIIKLRKYSSFQNDPKKYNAGQPTTGDTWTVNKDIFDFFIKRRQLV